EEQTHGRPYRFKQSERHVVRVDESEDLSGGLVSNPAKTGSWLASLTLICPGRACLALSTLILVSGFLSGSTGMSSPCSFFSVKLSGLPFGDQVIRPKFPPKIARSTVGGLRYPSNPNRAASVLTNLPPYTVRISVGVLKKMYR